MKNNVKGAIIKAKERINYLLVFEHYGEIPCKYKQGKHEINGLIIMHNDSQGRNWYENMRADVRVRSSTGKEYFTPISNLLEVEGLDEL